jgi:tetratricopeptide (TPR) repeat protein
MNQAKAAVKEVERLFDRLEDSGSSDALYAEGHLVLGNATREAARNASPVAREKALKEALLSYLRVQLLYGDIARPTAEALYRIGQCFSELGQQERAVAYWKQAAHRFGETNKWGIASMKKLQ